MPCRSPFFVDGKRGEKIPLPCGRCPTCRKRKVNEWVFRMMQEDNNCRNSFFVTLTYDTDNVPLHSNGYMSLDKSDLQKFFKKMRKRGSVFKYYGVGEYGSKSFRPHYHVIFFGNISEQHIFDSWNKGHVHIGNVSGASISYTVKYLDKPKKIPVHSKDTRLKEFSVMSKGLGKIFIENDEVFNHFKKNLANTFCYTAGGYKIPLPRYYRNRILSDEDKKIQRRIIDKEVKEADERERESYKGTIDYDKKQGLKQLAEWNKFKRSIDKRDKL